jgi:hypothetical protein
MTPTDRIDLNSKIETSRTSARIEAAGGLDHRRSECANFRTNFDDARYLDTPPMQHMTATWGS